MTVLTEFHCNNPLICKASSAENGTAKILSFLNVSETTRKGDFRELNPKHFWKFESTCFRGRSCWKEDLISAQPRISAHPYPHYLPPPTNHKKKKKKLKWAFFTVLSASRRMTYLQTLRSETSTRHHQRVR